MCMFNPVCVSFTSEERESWIRAKYEQRAFVAPLLPASGTQLTEDGSSKSMPVSLLSAVTERDLPRLLLLLAHSTKEQINAHPAGSPSLPRTALHAACQLGDVVMTQLLVWVGFCFLFFKFFLPFFYSPVKTVKKQNLFKVWMYLDGFAGYDVAHQISWLSPYLAYTLIQKYC